MIADSAWLPQLSKPKLLTSLPGQIQILSGDNLRSSQDENVENVNRKFEKNKIVLKIMSKMSSALLFISGFSGRELESAAEILCWSLFWKLRKFWRCLFCFSSLIVIDMECHRLWNVFFPNGKDPGKSIFFAGVTQTFS